MSGHDSREVWQRPGWWLAGGLALVVLTVLARQVGADGPAVGALTALGLLAALVGGVVLFLNGLARERARRR